MEYRLTGKLAGRLAGRIQAPAVPLTAQVISWLDLLDLCQELDECLTTMDTTNDSSLGLHKAVVSLGIGCGEWLLHQIRSRSADISGTGQTMEALEASLELLRIIYRSRHPDFTAEELKAAQQRIFNAAA